MSEREEWNKKVVEEFRANGGKVGGPFAQIPLLLLHHVGAKSGAERVNPLAYRRDGDALVVFASNGGRPQHPAWYFNLLADGRVTVEIGEDSGEFQARTATGDERERLWTQQKADVPGFADYEVSAAPREIPVIVLDPVAA
jgi:deazaflavin-dependent oxidoreductase (nitroreductase family)